MSFRSWRRRLVAAVALLLGGAGLVYSYGRFASTRYLIDAKLATLPSGRSVLVVQELIGSSRPNSQTLRFDFLDPASGERLERTNAPVSASNGASDRIF